MYSRSAFVPYGVVSVSLIAALALVVIPVQSQAQNLYVSNTSTATISVFNPAGNLVQTISGHLNNPEGLTFDSGGNLYASNFGASDISEFDSSGVFLKTIGSGNLNRPAFMAFSPTAQVASTPEPGSMALLTGLFVSAGAFAVRRRRIRK